MSGQSEDDLTKEEILTRLKKLRENAEKNHDHDLLLKIDDLWNQVYQLETY